MMTLSGPTLRWTGARLVGWSTAYTLEHEFYRQRATEQSATSTLETESAFLRGGRTVDAETFMGV